MDRCARPALSCLAAIAMAAVAPACIAQQAETGSGPGTSALAADVTADSRSESEPPRSAFGKVMSVLITALKENAATGAPASLEQRLEPRSSAATGTFGDIQVGSAFRLDAQPARPAPIPATASID